MNFISRIVKRPAHLKTVRRALFVISYEMRD